MNLCDLASAIFDVQPDTLCTGELISISALPDNILVRSFYANPKTGVDLLADFTAEQLDDFFFECKSLSDATEKVAQHYGGQPLTAEESNRVRDKVLNATIEAAIDVAQARKVDGWGICLESIITHVVKNIRDYIGQAKLNGKPI